MKILSSAKLKKELREDLETCFPNLEFLFYPSIEEAEKDLPEAEILITYGEDLTEAHIEQAHALKWIMVISAGLEKMPLIKIKEHHIMVTNAKGIHRIPMAEYTFTTILNVAKNTRVWFEQQHQANWDRRVKMEELHGETMAIIGAGAIGSEIARLAKAFGMTTVGVTRSGHESAYIDKMYTTEALLEACRTAKYIVAILPETRQTQNLLNADVFRAMRSEAVFVNIGRGKTVDQDALLQALQTNQIAHAILDVFEEEPLSKSHPFWSMNNVTVTPHFSSVTANYQPRALEIFKKNLTTYLNKENNFMNQIDLDRGY